MATRLYRSTDGGAPSLTGAAGSGINLLDTVLINGYNSKTVTITRSGSTATATCVGHGFPADGVTRITISGAGQTEYNVETYITNVTANTFDYTVAGSPATPATGTINAIVTPAGWSKAYTGTNLAAYKNSVAAIGTTHQRCLRIDDTNTTHMIACGYETMTDVSSGLGPMPARASWPVTGGGYWIKSTTANSTVRPWCIIASDTFFIYWHNAFGTDFYDPASGANAYAYGDYVPTWSMDQFPTLIIFGTGVTIASNSGLSIIASPAYQTAFASHSIQRALNGQGGSKSITKTTMASGSTLTFIGGGGYGPNTNGQNYFNFGHVYAQECAPDGFIMRGKIPGINDPISAYTMWSNGDILVPQSGNATGRKFIMLKLTTNSSTLVACMAVDFSDGWDV